MRNMSWRASDAAKHPTRANLQLDLVHAIVERAPELLGLGHGPRVDLVLINANELAILVQDAAVDDGGAAIFAHEAVFMIIY